MNNRILMWTTAVLALIGLAVNAGVDLDNVYDMTTTALWAITLVVAAVAALSGRGSEPAPQPAPVQQ